MTKEWSRRIKNAISWGPAAVRTSVPRLASNERTRTWGTIILLTAGTVRKNPRLLLVQRIVGATRASVKTKPAQGEVSAVISLFPGFR